MTTTPLRSEWGRNDDAGTWQVLFLANCYIQAFLPRLGFLESGEDWITGLDPCYFFLPPSLSHKFDVGFA